MVWGSGAVGLEARESNLRIRTEAEGDLDGNLGDRQLAEVPQLQELQERGDEEIGSRIQVSGQPMMLRASLPLSPILDILFQAVPCLPVSPPPAVPRPHPPVHRLPHVSHVVGVPSKDLLIGPSHDFLSQKSTSGRHTGLTGCLCNVTAKCLPRRTGLAPARKPPVIEYGLSTKSATKYGPNGGETRVAGWESDHDASIFPLFSNSPSPWLLG